MVDLNRLPRDNTLTRQLVPEEALRVPEFQAGGGRYLGKQVEAAGDAARELVNAYKQEQMRSQRFQWQANLETFRGEQDITREQSRRTAPPGAPDFTRTYMEQFDRSADNLRSRVPPGMEVEFNANLARVRRQAELQAFASEQSARDAHEKGQINQIFNQFTTQVDQNPAARAEVAERAGELIRSSGLSPEEKLAMERTFQAQIAEAEYNNLARRDPQQAAAALGGRNRITNPNSLAIIGRIQAEAKRMGLSDEQVQLYVAQFYIENPRFDPNARTPSGNRPDQYAFGLAQAIRGVRDKYGITEDTNDPRFIERQIVGGLNAMREHAQDFAKLMGVEESALTPGQRYLSYFQGPTGARAIIRAAGENPNISVGEALAAGVNPQHAALVTLRNPMLRNMTVGQLLSWSERRVNNAVVATGGVPDANLDVADPRFAAIPYERRTVLMNQARSMSEHTEALDYRQSTHGDVDRRNDVYKQGLDLLRENKLDAEWLTTNRTTLSPEQYNQFTRILSGQDDPRRSDPGLLAELRAQAADPETAQTAIRRSVEEAGNRLSHSDFKYILEQSQSTLSSNNREELRAHAQVTKLVGDRLYAALAPTTGSRFDRTAIVEAAEARRRLQEWSLSNRQASPEELAVRASEIQDEVVRTRTERSNNEAGLARAAPRALNMLGVRSPSQLGTVAPEKFSDAYRKLNDARRNNQVDDELYRQLNINLREFERQSEARRARKQ